MAMCFMLNANGACYRQGKFILNVFRRNNQKELYVAIKGSFDKTYLDP